MGTTDIVKEESAEDVVNNHLEAPDRAIPKIYKHPALLFSIIVVLIFISESLVMLIVSKAPLLSILLDSLLLTLILLPLLYILILKPFRAYITELEGMERKLNKEVITDDLTGLLNRRGLFTIAQNQCELASRNDFDLNFVFLDVDGMKMINDELGHKIGDQALMDLSKILRSSFRSSDIIGRIGGDEFTIIMSGAPDTNFSIVTKRLQNNLSAHNKKAGRPYNLSVSIGLTSYDHTNPCSFDDLLSTADKMMYDQKRKKCEELDKEEDRGHD
jgi:diguanylate cyclase (GGDEF)-like protein